MIMDNLVEWATILSPIIAVALAWYTSKSGARDARKTIKSIKELADIQIRLLQIQLEKEETEAAIRHQQANEEANDSFKRMTSIDEPFYHRMERDTTIANERDFQLEHLRSIQKAKGELRELKNRLAKK